MARQVLPATRRSSGEENMLMQMGMQAAQSYLGDAMGGAKDGSSTASDSIPSMTSRGEGTGEMAPGYGNTDILAAVKRRMGKQNSGGMA